MPRDIKVKNPKEKTIKTIDKPFVYSQRMKNKLVATKEKGKQDNEVEENEIQYATNRVSYSASDLAVIGTNEIKKDSKILYNKYKSQKYKEKILAKNKGTKTKEKTTNIRSNPTKEIKENTHKIREIKMKENAIKNSQKSINNSKKMLSSIKSAVHNTKETIKKTVKVTISAVKKIIIMLKALVALIIAGGTISVIVIVLICLIGFFFSSPLGIFFSSETPVTEERLSLDTAMSDLSGEVDGKIDTIKGEVSHDSFSIKTNEVNWKEIMTIYAVLSSNRETSADVMNMNDEEFGRLKDVFWNAVNITHDTEKYSKTITTTDKDGNKKTKKVSRTRLNVYITTKSVDEMIEFYNLTESEVKQVNEMLKEEYNDMWDVII